MQVVQVNGGFRLTEELVLTVLIGRGNEDRPPCKLLRPDSETLELDSRLRLELDPGGELIVDSQNKVNATTPCSNLSRSEICLKIHNLPHNYRRISWRIGDGAILQSLRCGQLLLTRIARGLGLVWSPPNAQ